MKNLNKNINTLCDVCFVMMGLTYIIIAVLGFTPWYSGAIVALIGTLNIIIKIK